MMYWDGQGAGGWAVGMIMIMIVFWGSAVALIWVGIRSLTQRPGSSGSSDARDPGQILDERLANGDIDPEDFQRRLELLAKKR